MDRVALCLRATSLGGVETCISHPASTSHRQLTAAELEQAGIAEGDLRLYGRLRGRRRPHRRPGAGASLTDPPAPRLSPWWMLAPALLFIANFVGGPVHERAVPEEHRLQRHRDRRHGRGGSGPDRLRPLRRVGVAAADRARRWRCGERRFARRSSWAGAAAVARDRLEPRARAVPPRQPTAGHRARPTTRATPTSGSCSRSRSMGLVLVAPAAEELVFRGLGFATLGRFALPATTVLFALAHGLAVLLIPVAIAGFLLGLLRMRTASVYPGMGVHMTPERPRARARPAGRPERRVQTCARRRRLRRLRRMDDPVVAEYPGAHLRGRRRAAGRGESARAAGLGAARPQAPPGPSAVRSRPASRTSLRARSSATRARFPIRP